MNEKLYKNMSSVGISSITVGIVVLITGLASGILMVVNGARLLKSKKNVLF